MSPMLHRLALCAVVFAAAATGAHGQAYTLPQVGLQNGGSCPQFAVQDRSSKTMLPLGCLDVASKRWKLTPGEVRQEGVNAATQAPPIFSGANAAGQPAGLQNFTFSGATWGLRYFGGPDFGNQNSVSSQRAIRCTTAADWRQYEACDSIDFYSRTGYVAPWAASTAYTVGDIRYNGDYIYRVTTAGTSAASGGPNADGGNIVDGSVRWTREGSKFSDAKVAWSLGAVAYAGSGDVWGMNPNLILGPGFKSKAYAMEIDIGNDSGFNATIGGPIPGPEGIWLGGAFTNTSLGGFTVGGFAKAGNPMFVYGYWCKNALTAKDACYMDWSDSTSGYATATFANKTFDFQASANSQAGFAANGNKATAGFLSETVGPVGFQVRGANTFAAFADTGSAPQSVWIQGSHSTAAILDQSTTASAIKTQGNYSYSAINTQGSSGAGSAFALTMANNQKLCFVGQDACFSFDQAAGKLYFATAGVNRFSVDINGNIRAAGTITPNVTP